MTEIDVLTDVTFAIVTFGSEKSKVIHRLSTGFTELSTGYPQDKCHKTEDLAEILVQNGSFRTTLGQDRYRFGTDKLLIYIHNMYLYQYNQLFDLFCESKVVWVVGVSWFPRLNIFGSLHHFAPSPLFTKLSL